MRNKNTNKYVQTTGRYCEIRVNHQIANRAIKELESQKIHHTKILEEIKNVYEEVKEWYDYFISNIDKQIDFYKSYISSTSKELSKLQNILVEEYEEDLDKLYYDYIKGFEEQDGIGVVILGVKIIELGRCHDLAYAAGKGVVPVSEDRTFDLPAHDGFLHQDFIVMLRSQTQSRDQLLPVMGLCDTHG